MFAFILIALQAVEPAPPLEPSMMVVNRPQSVVSVDDFELSAIGSCEGREGSIEMQKLWLLQNKEVEIETPDGPRTVTVDREKLSITEVRDDDSTLKRIWQIDEMLTDEDEWLDLQLSLGVLQGALVVYWRETFQNRMYKQGLFRVAGSELVPLCEGQGGINVSH